MEENFREIPYNYTSFSDKEIILKYFDKEVWDTLNKLRTQRKTGRSAKLLFEILGDIFIVDRNPYIFNDFLENPIKQKKLQRIHKIKLNTIEIGSKKNPLVSKLIKEAQNLDIKFFAQFKAELKYQKKILNAFKKITKEENIQFSAFDRVSHVTDATDWRVEYPEVIIYPDSIKEIPKLITTAKNLNLKIIPRGGGTGLSGGAVPVQKNTLIINTEKLRKINEIEIVSENNKEIAIVEVETGVITENANQYCKRKGYVFATDPTSSWASTIGGNIAENAGGKKAVIWGTTIDNIYSFKIVDHTGTIFEVKRKNHPHRKIWEEDAVTFEVYNTKTKKLTNTIELLGTDIRKKGVGKDITNKALGGVPGIQKEGGDGIIISAKFVLYKPFQHKDTLCLEFYGKNLINASKAIVEIKNYFKKHEHVVLTALEHFDEKYEEAINYRNKSNRSERPKAVLLVDMESNNKDFLKKEAKNLIELVKKYNTEAFLAQNEFEQEKFWKDRKNLGAIAQHTNAFKLNEDVVLPVKSLPTFANFAEKLNIEKELSNNIKIINTLLSKLKNYHDNNENEFIESKKKICLEKLELFKKKNSLYKKNIDKPGKEILKEKSKEYKNFSIFELIQEEILDIDITQNILNEIHQTFYGYDEILQELDEIFNEIKHKKIIIATHMHAGDGNIHVNIPVNSNDYEMMKEAEETVAVIMKKTVELDGVISGEHGIGLTKLKFIDKKILDKFQEYKAKVDPEDLFNPGKLSKDFQLNKIYTPSLNLLKTEAFILEVADLKDLTASISSCVRCGKCKEVCNTQYSKLNMFYSPRNKILAISLITEAVLYEAQTAPAITFRNFKMLREVSDHCTICHKCFNVCPVNIDFGEVTLKTRNLLVERKKSKFKFITTFVLFYLQKKGYYFNKLLRIGLLRIGYSFQRLFHYINKPFSFITKKILPKIDGILKDKLPKAGDKTLRESLNLKGANTFFSFENKNMEIKKSVFYFPGCGSERMFTDINDATIAMLYNAGIRVVIAPEFLCCGYPLLANGKVKKAQIKTYQNSIIFHKISDTVGYMNIQDVIVSCGTCYEMLDKYQFENIFPGSKISDVNEFIANEKLYSTKVNKKYLYHEPCHTPLKGLGFEETFKQILDADVENIPNCCGEGGTLALSTPDISNTLRARKANNIKEIDPSLKKETVLTTCPSCVQGLSKINDQVSITGKSMIVELADIFLGKNWKKKFIKDIKKNNSVEKIIF